MDSVAASRQNGAVGEFGTGGGGEDEVSFDELVEIERATALVQDRDPGQAEAVVAARLRAKAERAKRDEQVVKLREAAEQKRRSRNRRIAALVVGGVALAASAYPLTKAIQEEMHSAEALGKLLDEASQSVQEHGFKQKDEWLDVDDEGVTITIPKGTCSAVVAVRQDGGDAGPLRIERARAKAIEGPGGHLWCSCDDEEVVVRLPDADGQRAAIRWLTTGTVVAGGVDVLETVAIPGFTLRVDDFGRSCADQAFEAWSAKTKNGRLPDLPATPPEWIAPLVAEGLTPVGVLDEDRAFAVVDVAAGHCMLATAQEPGGPVTLRGADGQRLIEKTTAALAWCSYEEETRHSLWRGADPGAAWAVLTAEADRIGGMTGLRELALRLELPELQGVIVPAELGADAMAALLASSVSKDEITKGTGEELASHPDHRVVAFSMFQEGAYVVDETSLAPMGCHPMPDPKAALNAFVCVQARPQAWRPEGSEHTQAAACSKLPFWMSLLADATQPEALQAAAKLLGFARRMAARGAEPSSAFGVQDAAWGATVRGHANKRSVVAVGITKSAPWVHPLSKDQPWTLDGPVPMLEVAPDDEVELRSKVPLGFDAASRRVVAWRR